MLTDIEIQEIITAGVLKYSAKDIPLRRQAIDRDIADAAYKKGQEDRVGEIIAYLDKATNAEELSHRFKKLKDTIKPLNLADLSNPLEIRGRGMGV